MRQEWMPPFDCSALVVREACYGCDWHQAAEVRRPTVESARWVVMG